jgi:hypothetical protein
MLKEHIDRLTDMAERSAFREGYQAALNDVLAEFPPCIDTHSALLVVFEILTKEA